MKTLKEFLSSLEDDKMVRKGNKKLPLSEVPSGETLKVGTLLDGIWTNVHLQSNSEELRTLLELAKLEGVKTSLEWI